MITDLIFSAMVGSISLIFGFLPVVSFFDFPFVGDSIGNTLLSAVQIWNTFLETFPYAVIVWNMFLYVILPFEGLLLLAKFFFGNRTPINSTN